MLGVNINWNTRILKNGAEWGEELLKPVVPTGTEKE